MRGTAWFLSLAALLAGSTVAGPPSTADKTLVAWAAPATLDQQGGSVLTIQDGSRFDAIVLGQRARGKWMAASEGFSGTGFSTKEGRPAIIYHGRGRGRNVVHYPADDTFDSWTEPEIVLAKNADGSVPGIRRWAPDCWLMNATYYAYSGGKNPQPMTSPDLKNWTYLDLSRNGEAGEERDKSGRD